MKTPSCVAYWNADFSRYEVVAGLPSSPEDMGNVKFWHSEDGDNWVDNHGNSELVGFENLKIMLSDGPRDMTMVG